LFANEVTEEEEGEEEVTLIKDERKEKGAGENINNMDKEKGFGEYNNNNKSVNKSINNNIGKTNNAKNANANKSDILSAGYSNYSGKLRHGKDDEVTKRGS